MSGEVITIASGKGGVGKTATAVNLAISFRLHDHSVVIVDGDLGMPNLAAWFDTTPDATLHDVLAQRREPMDAVRREARGFGILAGSGELEDYSAADPSRFAYVIDRLCREYDFVVIDTGGGLSYENSLPLQLADHIILVTSPNPPAIDDTKRTMALVELLESPILGVVVTKATDTTDPDAIARELGYELLGVIPFDQTIDESVMANQPLEMFDANSPASEAYRTLGAELLNEEEPVTRRQNQPSTS